jgi:hypothetical protein
MKTLTSAIEDLSKSTNGGGYNLAPMMSQITKQLAVYQNAVSHPIGEPAKEEIALCYTVGILKFTHFEENKKSVRYGLLDMDLFNLDGRWNGRYLTIWKPEIPVPEKLTLQDIPVSQPYTGPWDKVKEHIPTFHMRANSNAAYTFQGHGTPSGTMYATGPANLLITPLKGGGAIFQVSVAAYVTGGTEDFKGARGTNTALGSSFVPSGVEISNIPEDLPIPGVTVSTFRFVREENIG